jgi:quercetin dioxygenase-like cupin family protein
MVVSRCRGGWPLASVSVFFNHFIMDRMISPKVIAADAGTWLNVLGDHQLVKLTTHDTDGLFTVVQQINEPGTGLPAHVHSREDETFLVLEGQVEFVLGESPQILGVGDLAYAPRGLAHSFRVVSTTPAKMLIQLAPAGLEKMFQELSELPTGPPDLARVAQVCSRYGIVFL